MLRYFRRFFKTDNYSKLMNLTISKENVNVEKARINADIIYKNEIKIINDKQDYISIVLSVICVLLIIIILTYMVVRFRFISKKIN